MKIPGTLPAPAFEIDPISKDFEVVRQSYLPIDLIELDEAGTDTVTVFTVPDGQYYIVKKVTYYCQVAGSLTISATPDGDSFAAANTLFSNSLAQFEEGAAEILEGQIYGPGEKMVANCSVSGSKINIKVSVERITAGTS